MVDTVTPEKRSSIMSRIRSKDTVPEMVVRKLIFSMGYRYRLHRKDLPGCPDIVFPGRKKVIFVHGCFWHMHNCKFGRMPKVRQEYWIEKMKGNKRRDQENIGKLESHGWKVLVIWECEIANTASVEKDIKDFLDAAGA